ncbi:hypothetical protein DFQ10_105169 [Winogradskyella eximia]|uniref:Polyketide cyclase/dehydrase/lipid transport protein n=1 Tax=Winogradskyella eximia TaxID=262006 RepID=A0A3D9H240_9FLAO|nr:hypothetical protein [Winogradskyella eximia]RED43569.1 hypothetical protein DFQ10_105169 [Winogradskyella eximia]
MRVVNIHKRSINQPKEKVSELFKTLATSEDLVWPYDNWPAIKFKDGIQVGSRGGHGQIRYTIIEIVEGEFIKFQFSKPDGFIGFHELKIREIHKYETEIRHEIHVKANFKASLLWVFVIRWLHDALIEDAFDKVENYFTTDKKVSTYNLWVKLLREIYKRKSIQTKTA